MLQVPAEAFAGCVGGERDTQRAGLGDAEAFEPLMKYEIARRGDKKSPDFTVTLRGAGDKKIEIKSDRFLFRYAPVEEIGVIGSMIAPFVGAPTSFTARATLVEGDQRIPGLLEIEYGKDE